MAQKVIIKDLIVAAAQGASAGVKELQKADIAVELQEFEIEVTYSCTTEVTEEAAGGVALNFYIVSAKFDPKTTTKNTTTYGLKVRFVFVPETEAPT